MILGSKKYIISKIRILMIRNKVSYMGHLYEFLTEAEKTTEYSVIFLAIYH